MITINAENIINTIKKINIIIDNRNIITLIINPIIDIFDLSLVVKAIIPNITPINEITGVKSTPIAIEAILP